MHAWLCVHKYFKYYDYKALVRAHTTKYSIATWHTYYMYIP